MDNRNSQPQEPNPISGVHPPEDDRVALAAKLLDLVNSSWMSQAISVAAELGLADLLGSGAKPADELARATGCHAPSLQRLLRALATLGLCTEQDDGRFTLTEMGALLRADAPGSVRSWAIWWGKYLWPVWANLRHSIQTGENARQLVTGTAGFAHLEQDTERAAIFNAAMVELTRLVGRQVVRACDFSGMKTVVDVGGGLGELLAAVLEANPRLHGILFDLPHAIQSAAQHLRRLGVSERCELVSGNFFESVPSGADAYLLKSVLHDWEDERCAVILRNCRQAMAPGAKLLLVERIMPTKMETSPRHQGMARADLNMLLAHGAHERTESEFRDLLKSQGFQPTRIIPAALDLDLIEAVPIRSPLPCR